MAKTLTNKSVKNILRIRDEYGYKAEIVNEHGWGRIVIRDPFFKSPYANVLKSKRTSMWYIRKLEDSGEL